MHAWIVLGLMKACHGRLEFQADLREAQQPEFELIKNICDRNISFSLSKKWEHIIQNFYILVVSS